MACHEMSALRLGMMNVLGIKNEAAKDHDERELGEGLTKEGPIKSLANSKTLEELKTFYQSSLTDLEKKIGDCSDDKELAYLRSLLILTKKVELDLENHMTSLNSFYRGLDEMHDFVHEIYPA